jgi:integrase
MGYIYRRGTMLWMGFTDAAGREKQEATGFVVGQEAKARRKLARTEASVAAEVARGTLGACGAQPQREAEPLTVAAYAAEWNARRIKVDIVTATDDAARLRDHALPELGELPLWGVRPHHIRDLVLSLRGGKLAPRTVRHVYGALHTMFKDAVVDELVDTNPCVLKRGDLPKNTDKDPTWRAGALFRLLVSSDRVVPEDRRVLYALQGLAGLRFGEAAALRWRLFDRTRRPLGMLLVASSYNTTKKSEKRVKTDRPREVPVHPVLAEVLDAWWAGGWEAMMERPPTGDDLIVPSRKGEFRSRHHGLKKFRKDCERLGLRLRRQHDLRRTFISLARADGARKDVLERVTHGPRGNIMDQYTELPWSLLCEEVAKLRLPDLSSLADEAGQAAEQGRALGRVATGASTRALAGASTRALIGTPTGAVENRSQVGREGVSETHMHPHAGKENRAHLHCHLQCQNDLRNITESLKKKWWKRREAPGIEYEVAPQSRHKFPLTVHRRRVCIQGQRGYADLRSVSLKYSRS